MAWATYFQLLLLNLELIAFRNQNSGLGFGFGLARKCEFLFSVQACVKWQMVSGREMKLEKNDVDLTILKRPYL